jgi:hypothetical protein
VEKESAKMTVRERAAKLLGNGVEQEVVATALGVTPGYISQLLGETEFALEVSQLRLLNLENATERDGKYDTLEDKMLGRLEELEPYMTKPREVLGALQVLNRAVRRGVKPEQAPQVKQDVVVLQMPVVIQNKFVVNELNQVVAVGSKEVTERVGSNVLQDLTTITSKSLLEKIRKPELVSEEQGFERERNDNGTAGRERVSEGARS